MGDVLQEISRPSPLMRGGADLMGALLGGGRVEQAAKQKEEQRLLQNQGLQAGVDRKITQAMLERDKRTAQQRYVDDLVATGTAPEMARVQGDTMIGGDANLAQAQAFDLRHRAEAALHADPNITEANAILGALAGKPLVSTAVQGGEVIGNRYGAAPTITDTGLTTAKIGAENARAGMANAHAGVYNAQTAAGGYSNGNPKAADAALDALGIGGGSYQHPTKASKEADAVLQDARSDPANDLTGYSTQDIMHALSGGKVFTPPQRSDNHSVRIIEPKRVSYRGVDPSLSQAPAPAAAHGGGIGDIVMNALHSLGIGGGDTPAAPAAPAIPPAALSRLREGVHTQFGNGQVWTLQGGQPVQVQ